MSKTEKNYFATYGARSIIIGFQWRPSAILDFKNSKFEVPLRFCGAIWVILTNFVAIGPNVAEIWRILSILKWQPFTVMESLYACLDHPHGVLDGVYRCAKVG